VVWLGGGWGGGGGGGGFSRNVLATNILSLPMANFYGRGMYSSMKEQQILL